MVRADGTLQESSNEARLAKSLKACPCYALTMSKPGIFSNPQNDLLRFHFRCRRASLLRNSLLKRLSVIGTYACGSQYVCQIARRVREERREALDAYLLLSKKLFVSTLETINVWIIKGRIVADILLAVHLAQTTVTLRPALGAEFTVEHDCNLCI